LTGIAGFLIDSRWIGIHDESESSLCCNFALLRLRYWLLSGLALQRRFSTLTD